MFSLKQNNSKIIVNMKTALSPFILGLDRNTCLKYDKINIKDAQTGKNKRKTQPTV